MVLKATKVGQGDKTLLKMLLDKTLLDIHSHVPVTEKMLGEAMVESFLDAPDAGYMGDVHNVRWRASDDVSILFEDDDAGEETANTNYFSASLSPPVGVSTPLSPASEDHTLSIDCINFGRVPSVTVSFGRVPSVTVNFRLVPLQEAPRYPLPDASHCV